MTTTVTNATAARASAAVYEALAALTRGRVILPADADYDQVRAAYNAMIDRRPAAVLRCRDVADLIADHGTIFGGPVLYDLADTREVMQWYRELLPNLPEELSGFIALPTVSPVAPFPEALWGRKVCAIVWYYTGPLDKAPEVTAPVRDFGSPLLVGLHEMPFNALPQGLLVRTARDLGRRHLRELLDGRRSRAGPRLVRQQLPAVGGD